MAIGSGQQGGLLDYLKRHATVYVLVTVTLVMGVAFGAAAVGRLSQSQKQELLRYVVGFFQTVSSREASTVLAPARLRIAQRSVLSNIRTALVAWVLGVSVIGAPLILVVLFARGFVLGFTVGFLVEGMVLKGVIVSILSVLPASLLVVPGLLACCASGLSFAGVLVGGRLGRTQPGAGRTEFMVSSLVTVMSVVLLAIAGLLDAYIVPVFMQVAARYLI